MPQITPETIVSLWGGFGGWLGIAYAVYLHRMRSPYETNAAHILGVFAMGFTMLLSSVLIVGQFPGWVSLLGVAVAYTMLIVAETALFGQDAAEAIVADLKQWGLDKPYFVRKEKAEAVTDQSDANE